MFVCLRRKGVPRDMEAYFKGSSKEKTLALYTSQHNTSTYETYDPRDPKFQQKLYIAAIFLYVENSYSM